MKEKWNERYNNEDYFFGKEPNAFLMNEVDKLTPGRALFLGDGEGRNSVYTASLGWKVDAIDISDVGKNKADRLAKENKVELNYQVADALQYDYPPNTYDAIALIYFHVDDELREIFSEKIIRSLKPNGTIILLVYEEGHIKNGNGGPSNPDLLYTLSSIAENFIDLEFKTFEKEQLSRIKKGSQQEATIIKFVGKKV
jgi:SAM-dependent methyltransferase